MFEWQFVQVISEMFEILKFNFTGNKFHFEKLGTKWFTLFKDHVVVELSFFEIFEKLFLEIIFFALGVQD